MPNVCKNYTYSLNFALKSPKYTHNKRTSGETSPKIPRSKNKGYMWFIYYYQDTIPAALVAKLLWVTTTSQYQ